MNGDIKLLDQKCTGCAACYNVCPKNAITMQYDKDKFKYPVIDSTKCINCHLCKKVCPIDKNDLFNEEDQKVFGGYNKDVEILKQSTSGGAFSAIVDTFCDENYVIFGVVSNGIYSYHDFIIDKNELSKFRQSKYVQSDVGDSYKKAKEFLKQGKKVLFSGTPCQIAGLKSFLNKEYNNLLLVEVICEGVPSPLYAEKYSSYICNKKKKDLDNLEYRFKDTKKWDFEVMKFNFKDGTSYKLDRWFNPFWNIWLKHLMSRPSCYECQFARKERVADITLGDLWGVHLYCPDLYNKNRGASVIFVNTEKGLNVIKNSDKYLYYRELDIYDAIRYQGPLRTHIKDNPDKIEFMNDLHNMEYEELIKKWYTKPSFKLLYSKYVWGNRQKMFVYNLTHKKKGE